MLGPGANWVGSGPDANIVLDRPGVQPRHCELHVSAFGVTLQVPPGAKVRVNAREVDGMIALRPGDLVSFEHVEARLASHEATVPTPHAALPVQAPVNDDLAATTVRPAVPRYVLRGISSAGFGRTFPLPGPTTLGRAPECGIHLDHPGLSRRHARLTPTDEGLLIEDLGSTNGCLLNEARVQRAWAQHGDEVGFDVMRFRVVVPGRPERTDDRRRTLPVQAGGRGRPLRWAVVALLMLAATWLGVRLLG